MRKRSVDALSTALVAVLALGGLAAVSLAGGLGSETDAAGPPTTPGTFSAGTPTGAPDPATSGAHPPDVAAAPNHPGTTEDGSNGRGRATGGDDGIPDRILPPRLLASEHTTHETPASDTTPATPEGAPDPSPPLPVPIQPIVPGPGTPLPMRTQAAADGSRVVGAKWADTPRAPQGLDVTIHSKALGKDTTVRLLLPRGWSASGSRPTLYMLPGYNDWQRQNSWTAHADLGKFMAGKQAIAVLPDTGPAAFPSNWQHGPQYETYLTQELPTIMKSYGANGKRAIAGLSVGGYGAMALAARHPDLYQAVASYSGILDTTMPVISSFIQLMLRDIGIDPDDLWGKLILDNDVWRAHDPWWQAKNLKGMDIFVSAGTGVDGRYDKTPLEILKDATTHPGQGRLQSAMRATFLEAGASLTTHSFVTRCATLGIPVTTDYTAKGTHTWPYWQDAFRKSWFSTLAPALGIDAS